MTQVSYGTITITDTNDIESIIVEYARNQSTSEAPASGWSTTRPAWAQGYYIWQRTRIHKSGTQDSADTFGTAVCLTGSTGQTGQTGATGQSLSSTKTQYTNVASNVTITTSNHTNYTWTDNVPAYDSSKPIYWGRITNIYVNPAKTEYLVYKDQGTTDAITTAAAANSTANTANQTANNAKNKADTVEGNLNSYITSNNNALNALQTKTKYFWTNLVAHTNGSNGWTKPNYPVGTYAASGISGTTFDEENSSTYGYNTLYANGIKLRYNAINLGELTGSSLVFYRPSTTAQGSKGMELDSSALKFYDATGTVAQATFGGTQATISGTINVYDGKIGNNANNYWYIGNYTDYNQNYSAIIKSKGTASIQLNETNTWRISTNRIHTAWAPETGTDAFKLHFPKFNDSKTVNKYWDFGLHLPISYSDKFLYIRNASGSETLDNLLNDLDDGGYDYWKYRFYISADGSLYAKNLYVLDDDGNTTQIGGTDGVYLLKSGGTITGNLEVNGTLTKGGKTVTYLTTTPTSGQILIADGTSGSIKTSGYTIATSVPSGAIFTDYRVKTEARGSTTMYLAGSNSSGTVSQGTLLTDSGVYIQTSSSSTNLVVPKINGYTLAAASAKGVDTSLTTSSTSTNLPTSKAVVDLIKQYLPLTGGSITGPVNFGDSVSIDDLTAGNLIVSGAGRFTNGLYGDLIGNADTATTATTATKVGKDLKIQLNSGTTEDTNQFTFNGSAAKTVNITKSSIGLSNVENKSSATIRGELTSSNVTTALGFTPYNATNPNGYTTNTGTVTSVKVQGSNGLTGSGTVTTTGTITLSHDDTSSQASSSNSGRTYIQSITLDSYGHVTGLSTATETVTNTHNTAYLYAGASNGTANAATTNGNTYLILMDGGSATTRRKVSGSGTVSVASDASGNITITGSAHPTSLKNPNALTVKVYNGTSTSSDISYDGSTSGQSVSVAGTNAITGITASAASGGSTTFTLTKANGGTSTFDVTVTASVATGATTLTDASGATISKGSATKPVYFSSGVPAEANTYAGGTAVTLNNASKAGSTASFYAPTSGGTSSQVLIGNGTTSAPVWTSISSLVPSSATNATNDSDGHQINTTYVKVDGTNKMTGNLIIRKAGIGANDWASRESNPSLIFETTDGQTAGFVYTQYDSVQAPDSVTLASSQSGTYFIAPNIKATGNFYGNLSGNATSATTANCLAQNTEMTYAWNGINYFNISAANQSAAKVNDTPHSTAVWTHILRFNHANSTGYYTDLAVPFNENGIFYKRICGGSLQNSTTNGGWVRVVDVLGTTMVGALNFANNTYNKVGDDAQFGDINQAGKIGIKGINGATGIQFVPYSGSTGQTISIDGAGTMSITSNVSVANNLSSIWYNSYRWYANQNPNWWYRYSTTFTTSTVPTANWYIRVQLNCAWDPHLKPCVCMANYSNRAGVLYYEIDSHLYQDKWRAYLTNYGTNFISTKRVMESVTIDGSSVNRMVLYFELAKPTEYNGSTPNGTFTIYSPVPIDSITSVSAPTDMTTLDFGENLHGANITITSGSLIGKATLDGSGNTITSTYLNKAGDTMTGTLGLRPASGEGGQIELRASAANTTQAGIVLDQYNSTFRIFGMASEDGSTKTGVGTPLVIDPYGKTITGGYTLTGALSGNASTATKLANARTIQTNLASTSSASFDGSNNITPGVTGTLAVGNGGTGQTSLINAANSLLNSLSTGSSTPVDADYYISQYVNGGTTTTTYHRRPMSALWSYISGKISSSGTYVTVNTNQTLTAAGTKTYLGLQTYGSDGLALGVTNGSAVTQKAAMHYDSTLEAIVFSFA